MDLSFGDTNDSNTHRGNTLSMSISIKESKSIINNLPQRKHQSQMVSLVILLNIWGRNEIASLQSLKLNIQKTKIMASGPITSWEIHGETVETVAGFIFGGSKITVDGDCSHEIKRCLLSSVQLLSRVRLFVTPWIAARQASLPTNSWSSLKLMSIESVMPSSHLILCCPPSPPAPNPSQHQSLFQWVNSSHEVAKVLEFQLKHQSFQWTPRTGFL